MFFEKYSDLCSKAGKSPNKVAKELSISSGSVTEWKKGRVPQNATVLKIANYFGVTTDYLLGKADEKAPAPADLDENIKKYLLLNAEGKKKAGERIDELLELPKYRNAHTEEQIAAAIKQITEDSSDVGSLLFNLSRSKK